MNQIAQNFARWAVMGRKDFNEALITVVRLHGVLQAAGGRSGPQTRRLLNADRVEKWLYRAFTKELRPAACALSINSPGGSPAQAELISDTIGRLSKATGIPVYAFAEDVAASGGYWLMTAGDKLYACETSLVGSIGVVSASFGAVEAMQRLGLERRVWTAGEAKAQIEPFSPVKPEQEARLREVLEDVQRSFVRRVQGRRGDRLKGDPKDIFSGRPWTGHQAVGLGLVDGIGDLQGTMKQEFGDKARFLLCSDPPAGGLRDALGLSSLPQPLATELAAGRAAPEVLATEAAYAMAREAAGGAFDELEGRSIWEHYRLS